MLRSHRNPLLAGVSFLALATFGRAGVIVVAPSGGQYTQIQAAVVAANPGDVLLVRSGTYAPVTVNGKPLTITADTGATVTIQGTTRVVNLPAGGVVVLSGLRGRGLTSDTSSEEAGAGLLLRSNSGFVRVQGCEFTGAIGFDDGGTALGGCCNLPNGAGWDAARVESCNGGTTFTSTILQAGRAANVSHFCYCGIGQMGGDGLLSLASMVALYDCTLNGGAGGGGGFRGGVGGSGLVTVVSQGVLASNTVIAGGMGGDGYDFLYCEGGDGGTGARLGTGTSVQRIGSLIYGGPGGQNAGGGAGPPGAPGDPTSGSGSVFTFAGPRVQMIAPLLARESTSPSILVRGAAGRVAAVTISRLPRFQPLPSWRGVLLVQQTIPARWLLLGTIPANGELQGTLDLRELGTGVASATWFLQAVHTDPVEGTTLGTGQVLTVLDSIY